MPVQLILYTRVDEALSDYSAATNPAQRLFSNRVVPDHSARTDELIKATINGFSKHLKPGFCVYMRGFVPEMPKKSLDRISLDIAIRKHVGAMTSNLSGTIVPVIDLYPYQPPLFDRVFGDSWKPKWYHTIAG
jgi:hypothetical protein